MKHLKINVNPKNLSYIKKILTQKLYLKMERNLKK